MSEDVFPEDKRYRNPDSQDSVETPVIWFVGINGQQHGPLFADQLMDLIYRKELGPFDYVWREGMQEWAYLHEVSELRAQVERMQAPSEHLPLSGVAEQIVEPIPRPNEVDLSPDQNEIDSGSDARSADVAIGDDSAQFTSPSESSAESNDVKPLTEEDEKPVPPDETLPSTTDDKSNPLFAAPIDSSTGPGDRGHLTDGVEASIAVDRTESAETSHQNTLKSETSEDVMSQDSDDIWADIQKELSEAEEQAASDESTDQDSLRSETSEDPMPQDSDIVRADGQEGSGTEAEQSELDETGDREPPQLETSEDPMLKDSNSVGADADKEASAAQERIESDAVDDQDALQSEASEVSITQDSDAVRADIREQTSAIVDQIVSDGVTDFKVPSNNSFGIGNETKSFDDTYSLYNLVSATRQASSPVPTQSPDGYAAEDNSGLIDLAKIGRLEDGSPPDRQPNRVEPLFGQKFDSLIPTERTIAYERNKPVKIAIAAGVGILTIAVAASFLILNYRHLGQDSISSTSLVAPVSQSDSQSTSAELQVGQEAIQPLKAASTSTTPEIKTVLEKKVRVSAEPAVAAINKDSSETAIENITVRKKSKPALEKVAVEKQAQGQTSPTEKEKSKVSTDELLDWAIGKRDKTSAPSAAEDKPSSAPSQQSAVTLPEQPSREQTLAAMRNVAPAVKACGSRTSGIATAAISVEGASGKVTKVTITGVDSSVHDCMRKAIGRANFPSFSKKKFDIKYPFRL